MQVAQLATEQGTHKLPTFVVYVGHVVVFIH